MMTKATILLVEDNPELNEINREALGMEGYRVLEADTIAQAEALAAEVEIDLIVLDILLPDGSGLDLCRRLRQKRDVPVLFLSALGQPVQRVEGLRAGGDDYLCKPYLLDELVARIEALLRRASSQRAQERVRFDELQLHPRSRRAICGGQDLLLSPKEYAVLELLAKTPGEFLSTETIYETIWGLDALEEVSTVREHIYRLRRKLGETPPIVIQGVRGKGYRMKVVKS